MEEFVQFVKQIDKTVEVTFEDENCYYLSKESWKNEILFDFDDLESAKEEIYEFLNYRYVPNKGLLSENYVEFCINIPNYSFIFTFSGKELPEDIGTGEIAYEIGPISDEFAKFLTIHHRFYDSDPDEYLTTIKIYNIDRLTGKNFTDKDFSNTALAIAKSIFFDLSYKYSVTIGFVDMPESDDDVDPVYEVEEALQAVDKQVITVKYDKDLVDYYYRAMQMTESEFTYLAFFQVLECMFDEVYLNDTVQDVKQIVNSNWFSHQNNEHITQIIKLVEQYNKNKNDREKLKLVLERYFKGDVHDEAFFIVNKDIIELLKRMKLISSCNDLKDLQRLANIIYDYRCQCTHSNRTFPFRATFSGSTDELRDHITLVKKVAERVIVNYKISGVKNE